MSAKVEAAIDAGVKRILVPKSNLQDIILSKEKEDKIKIIPVEKISTVLKEALDWQGRAALKRTIQNINGD